MKIKCFSKRKLNVHISKTKIKCAILGFSQNCCILGKSREKLVKFSKNSAKIQQKFSKNSAKFWQILQHFVKISKKNKQFLTKKLRIENGVKECIVQISARAFQRVFTCKIWLRYSRERAYLISLFLVLPWSFNFHRGLPPPKKRRLSRLIHHKK